jgi:hypothetical protein
MKSIFFGLFAILFAATAPLRLTLVLQDNTADVTATWIYEVPADWEISFVWWVTEDVTGTEVARDTTGLHSSSWQHARTTEDVAFTFHLDLYRTLADGSTIGTGQPATTERYVVTARPPNVLVASSTETTSPDSIPHDPSMELAEGTLWLEFTPNSTVGRQGLWSKDFNGYEAGGHLTVILESDSIRFRIQSDVATYQGAAPGVAPDQRNQVAVTFGPGGFNGWLNGTQVMTNAWTGGLVGNTNAIVVGANSQGTEPWAEPLDGTMHTTELYEGAYDFSGRWGEPPIVPPPAVCDTCININLAMARTFAYEGEKHFQMLLAPATYRHVDYRIGQTERFMYEVWIDGAKFGYSVDADYGVVECHLAGQGEVCPVRPFRPGDGRPHLYVRDLARLVPRAPRVQLLGRSVLGHDVHRLG